MAKKIQLNTLIIAGKEVTTKELIEIVAKDMPRDGHGNMSGMAVDEMRKRIRVLEALEKAKADAKEVSFEDADFEVLKGCVKAFKWAIVDVNILKFTDQFEI